MSSGYGRRLDTRWFRLDIFVVNQGLVFLKTKNKQKVARDGTFLYKSTTTKYIKNVTLYFFYHEN